MSDPIEESISDVYFKAFSIKERIKSAYYQTYPSPTPIKLLDFFQKVCDAYQSRLLHLHSDQKASREAITREIKMISGHLCSIASHIRFAEGASVERTVGSFVTSLSQLVEEILPGAKLIVRPQWLYNFKIIDLIKVYAKPLSDALGSQTFADLASDLGDNLYTISFPGFEKNNILINTILGHEIGHPFADDYLESESTEYLSAILTEVEQEVPPNFTGMRRLGEIAKRTQEVVNIRTRGLQEFISDFVSIYLFNIGSLLSSESYCNMLRNIDEFSLEPRNRYYPPWRMRLRLMYRELEPQIEEVIDQLEEKKPFENQIKKSLIDKFQQIKSLVSDTRDENKVNADYRSRIAYAYIKSAIPNVIRYLDGRISKKYNLLRYCKYITNYCERIYNHIPPNSLEVGGISLKLADLQSIIIAGWVYKVAWLPTMFLSQDYDKYLSDLTTLNNLLSKAMELSDIHKEYETSRIRPILFRQFGKARPILFRQF